MIAYCIMLIVLTSPLAIQQIGTNVAWRVFISPSIHLSICLCTGPSVGQLFGQAIYSLVNC